LFAVAPAEVGIVDVDHVGVVEAPDSNILLAVAVPDKIAPALAVL
jgi:hypothetical protein